MTTSLDKNLNDSWPDKWTEMSIDNKFCKKDIKFDESNKSLFAYKVNYYLLNGTYKVGKWKFGVTDKMNPELYKDINTHKTCNNHKLLLYIGLIEIIFVTFVSLIVLGLIVLKYYNSNNIR